MLDRKCRNYEDLLLEALVGGKKLSLQSNCFLAQYLLEFKVPVFIYILALVYVLLLDWCVPVWIAEVIAKQFYCMKQLHR